MRLLGLIFVLSGCISSCPTPNPVVGSTVTVSNTTSVGTTVYVAFGADSLVIAPDWTFCKGNDNLNCSFQIPHGQARNLPLLGRYLNATFSFFQPVTCNTTKAEVNLNNPQWYDIGDISLVDGFNVPVQMQFNGQTIGPVLQAVGNEDALGVYPDGCDICVARQQPSCGLQPGTDGCKTGSQYDPDVPCQVQGTIMGGGNNDVMIELLDVEPASK